MQSQLQPQSPVPSATAVFPVYNHSGKFEPRAPLLALAVTGLLGFPLGYVYSYALKWIPIVLFNFLLTIGYGALFGFITARILKFCRARNNKLAASCGAITGLVALYFDWNGHIHALFEDAPILCSPEQIVAGMRHLYEHGSWSFHQTTYIGIPLAIVWVFEAFMIVCSSAMVCHGMISKIPFCEATKSWLDETKNISTLEPFTDPAHLEAFKAGDLGPLLQSKPQAPGSPSFARLTLKQSPRCQEFFTLSITNVTIVKDKHGKTSAVNKELTKDLVLPKSMLELMAKFEGFGEKTEEVKNEELKVKS